MPNMEITEFYDRYKHLDNVLSDITMVENFKDEFVYQAWKAIKTEVKKRGNK